MLAAIDRSPHADRTEERLADLTEDVLLLVTVGSAAVLAAVILVLMLVL
jgi:hypothetical protein